MKTLENYINLRKKRRIDYPYSVIFNEEIEKTHPEIFYMLLLIKEDTHIRVKNIEMEIKHLRSLIDKENEEAGYIEERLNFLLDKVHNSSFKSPEDKEKVVNFLYRYYNIEKFKKRIEQNEKGIPYLFVIEQDQNEREIEEELELEATQKFIEKHEAKVKKLREIQSRLNIFKLRN